MNFIYITIIGLLIGLVGTGAGGVLAVFVARVPKRPLSLIIEFCAGLMICVVCFDLLPESFGAEGLSVNHTDMIMSITGIIISVLTLIYAEHSLRAHGKAIGSAFIMSLGIILHNFPEGVALGAAFYANVMIGIGLAVVIILHTIPAGLIIGLPLKNSGYSKFKVVLYTALVGLPMGIGAFTGSYLGEIAPGLSSIILGYAAGAILYVVFGELIPEAQELHKGKLGTVGNIAGMIAGIIISFMFK